ncbi:MAG: hypothetical protein OEZ65_05995 [Gemmatimonadota bacterium]|nr:hypothetical protein [Gemmatimonadota bacterium]MDH5759123.1 hypothetical protein [Gemmatimonadota bacterium]
MSSLEPLINLIVVLAVLSLAAERATNLLKLGQPDLRVRTTDDAKEKLREQAITWQSVFIGVGLALLMKADMFEILASLNAPWDTLGWVRVTDSGWVRVPATANLGTALYAAGGSVVTGLALGFGSKFWHELLDGILELRGLAQNLKKKADPPTTPEG